MIGLVADHAGGAVEQPRLMMLPALQGASGHRVTANEATFFDLVGEFAADIYLRAANVRAHDGVIYCQHLAHGVGNRAHRRADNGELAGVWQIAEVVQRGAQSGIGGGLVGRWLIMVQ